MREKKWEYSATTVRQLLRDFKKAYELFRKEVLYSYSILVELWVLMNLVRLLKMWLHLVQEEIGRR
jgi:hypothetical protein